MSKRQEIKQDIKVEKGNVIAPNISNVKGSVIVGNQVTLGSLKDKGFDVDINPIEENMIRLGRFLYRKLGVRKFVIMLILGMLLPLGTGAYLYYSYSFDNLGIFISQNVYQVITLTGIFSVFLALGLYGNESKCKFCNSVYATIPIRRTVTDKGTYRGDEIYKIKEVRRCEICGKITKVFYTKRYEGEDQTSLLRP